MISLKIAFRNVFRNKRRTILTLLALVFGNVGLLNYLGYMNASFWGMRESVINGRLSHVQIYRKGFSEKGSVEPNKYMIENYDEIKSILQKDKMVQVITSRVSLSGILASNEQSSIFVGEGVEPKEDSEVSTFLKIIDGSDLSNYVADGIIAGVGLSKAMNAGVDSSLTLLTTTREGGINAIDVTVRGIMQTGTISYDNIAMKIPIKTAQRLLNTDAVTKIFVLLDKTENVPLFIKKLDKIIKSNNLDIEYKTWDEMAEFYHSVVNILYNFFYFVSSIIVTIIIFSIVNTLTMSVMERVTEIGTIRAIGTTRSTVRKLFLMEGGIIGVIGGVVGLLLGVIISIFINWLEIEMSPPPGSNMGYPLLIHISFWHILICFIGSFLISTLSSVLPARKASNLSIVESFRHT